MTAKPIGKDPVYVTEQMLKMTIMDFIRKFIKYLLHNPSAIAIALLRRLSFAIPDRPYLKMMFRLKMGYPLNLNNPKTFNEKLQWLKLYNRKPEYTQMVDKYAVKDYVAKVIGKEYIIPTIGVWDRFEDIDFSILPEQFVLKTTHGGGGGGIVICKDKSTFDKDAAKEKLKSSLKSDIYKSLREWPYRNVKKRIIAEQYMQDIDSDELKDYKFFCFNGKVQFFKIDFDRFEGHHANYYDNKGKILTLREVDLLPPVPGKVKVPDNLNEMIKIAETLSNGIPFIRIDLYDISKRIYFGEMTFFPASGFGKFSPEDADKKLGELLLLPQIN